MVSDPSDSVDQGPAGAPLAASERAPRLYRFEALYRRWRATAVAEAEKILESGSAAEDAAERVFSRLWRKGGWWDIEDPEAYFRRAGRREALDLRRRRRRHVPLADALRAPTGSPSESVLDEELRFRLEAELGRLPDRCRAVCRARWVDGLSRAEVADDLGISRKAVGKQLARGRRYLSESGFREWLSTLVDAGGGVGRLPRL